MLNNKWPAWKSSKYQFKSVLIPWIPTVTPETIPSFSTSGESLIFFSFILLIFHTEQTVTCTILCISQTPRYSRHFPSGMKQPLAQNKFVVTTLPSSSGSCRSKIFHSWKFVGAKVFSHNFCQKRGRCHLLNWPVSCNYQMLKAISCQNTELFVNSVTC